MISIFLCCVAFAVSYVAGRRSLVAGLLTVITVGYFYGILRANVPESFSHFIFDAAVVGLYVTQFPRAPNAEEQRSRRVLYLWVGALAVWSFLLFLAPVQDYMVQLVGLRGSIFLLPFVLLGARLDDAQANRLALGFAALNIIAFTFACAEYFLGVERFFPRNPVTELIYKSVVDENYARSDWVAVLRIPSTFTSAHAFAGTMVLTLTFLFGSLVQKRAGKRLERWRRNLLVAALFASVLGIFMAAARTPVIILILLVATLVVSRRLNAHSWALLLLMLVGMGWIILSAERLQRFMTLKDTEYVGERVYWSVNDSFLELVSEYPLGNGLGGGGTSMPYFLQSEVKAPIFYMENEYARIVLEQGVLGLCLWLGFIAWLFTRRAVKRGDAWFVGRRMLWVVCAVQFATGMIGKGLLTSIPGTALFLLSMGWVAVKQTQNSETRSKTTEASAETDRATAARAAETEGGLEPARAWARRMSLKI